MNDLSKLVAFLCELVDSAITAEIDGRIDIADLPLLIGLLPKIGPAFAGIKNVPGELAALSPTDAEALVAGVIAQLVIPDAKAKAVVESALKTAAALFHLYTTVKTPA